MSGTLAYRYICHAGVWPLPCDGVTKCFRAGKFPRTFAEEASGWRTRDTDIRHDCQLIPHFADVSADKFELASAPTCGMPIGGRSLHCTPPLREEETSGVEVFKPAEFALVTSKERALPPKNGETSSPSHESSTVKKNRIVESRIKSYR